MDKRGFADVNRSCLTGVGGVLLAAALVAITGCAGSPPAGSSAPKVPPWPDGPPEVARRGAISIACEPAPHRTTPGPSKDQPESRPNGHRGSLDKEVIRGVIRQHLAEIKACHDAILIESPTLAGRVETRFAIGSTGKVGSSCLVSSTLNRAEGERCIVDQILTWQFPEPTGGGWVIVTYPFNFTPADTPQTPAR